jgi:hypothetical protein
LPIILSGAFIGIRLGYDLNLAPTIYYGLKRFAFKARFMILILTIWVICLRVKITPTSL